MDAPTLTMEDFMGLTTLEEQADRSLVGMPKEFSDFTEMFAVDYNFLKKELPGESGKEVTLEEYLLGIRDAGKFDHKMNKPVQEFLSVVLDATIIKPLIESVTGEDMITGEDLSEFEKGMKLASGGVSLFTLGQGGVIINGGRVAFQSTLVTMGKMVAIDMVTTGVTYGTSELCQKMGMPGSVTMLLSMLAGGKVGNVLNNKWLANLSAEDVKRYQLWNELRQKGFSEKDIYNLEKYGSIKTCLDYVTTSGLDIESSGGITTTILGTYKDDMKYIVDELGNIKSTDFGARNGGLYVLNTPDELYVNANQFWEEYNKPWLDNAIRRKDTIKIATIPCEQTMYRIDDISGIKELTGFGKEYAYLISKEYVLDWETMSMKFIS